MCSAYCLREYRRVNIYVIPFLLFCKSFLKLLHLFTVLGMVNSETRYIAWRGSPLSLALSINLAFLQTRTMEQYHWYYGPAKLYRLRSQSLAKVITSIVLLKERLYCLHSTKLKLYNIYKHATNHRHFHHFFYQTVKQTPCIFIFFNDFILVHCNFHWFIVLSCGTNVYYRSS